MEPLPFYIYTVFAIATFLTIFLMYRATYASGLVLATILAWLALQAATGLAGFYTDTDSVPPRFLLTLLPPLVFIAGLFFVKRGRAFVDALDVRALVLLHIVRIPVELTLYGLYMHKGVPVIMTFEGRNFDIVCGLTAPFVWYFGYVKNVLGRNVLLAWNVVCLLLLANIVTTAIMSAPFPFQQLAFDRPNVAVLYFPFVWLPAFIVPAVLLAHLVTVRRLVLGKA